MKYNPEVHHRRSIRLKDYDYAQAGAYFITICTQGRECLFGEIKDGKMELNPVGRMVQTVWEKLPEHYPGVDIDEFIVMPNHVHGNILLTEIVGAGPRACPAPRTEQSQNKDGRPLLKTGRPQGAAPTLALGDVVYRFKSLTTTRYREGVQKNNWLPFPGRLWQRNYYEHIIRDEDSLNKIRDYVVHNPLRWEFDRENILGKPDGLEQGFWKVFGQNPKRKQYPCGSRGLNN